MTISAPRYGSTSSERLGRTRRVLAIVRRELRRRAGWGTVAAVVLAFVSVAAVVIVDAEFASLTGTLRLTTLEAPFESPIWPLLLLLVATSAGAGALAEDTGNRSIVLYLSRPIHLIDYVGAKAIACGTWILIAAAGPPLTAVLILTLLGVVPTSIAVSAALGYLAVGLLATIFLTGVALSLSSLTSRPLYAGVGIFGVVLSLFIGAAAVAAITGNLYVPYASPVTLLRSVGLGVFGGPSTPETDPATSGAVLAIAGAVLGAFAAWRASRVEVVSE